MIQMVDVFLSHCGLECKVGRLALRERKIYFEYENDFLSKNIQISPYMLPLKNGLQMCSDRVFEGLFGVFADSLPDGWGRLLLDRHFMQRGMNYNNISPLDRLCYIGKYGIGALSYKPIREELQNNSGDIILDDLANSSLEILQGKNSEFVDELLSLEGSSGGARPKIMLQIDEHSNIAYGNRELLDGYRHFIVKFPNSQDSKNSGKIEYIYSLIAREAGVDMPATKLLHTSKNSYFAVQRFDRVGDQKVHIHSACGLTHSDFRIPSLDYDDLLTLTFDITKDINEVKKMFRMAIFNLLMRNRDDHGKNFSFLLDCNNKWKLSPAYDLTFSSGPNGEHSTTYLGIGKAPTLLHIEKLALKHHIKEFKSIIEQTIEAAGKFATFAKSVDLPKSEMEQVLKILRQS